MRDCYFAAGDDGEEPIYSRSMAEGRELIYGDALMASTVNTFTI